MDGKDSTPLKGTLQPLVVVVAVVVVVVHVRGK